MSAAPQAPVPDYSYWYDALAGKFGDVHDSDARPGFWRKRSRRAGPFDPVAIWHDGTKMVALVNGAPSDAGDLWTYCCRFPVTKEQYDNRLATGMWHDEDAAVVESESLAHSLSNSQNVDEAEILRGEIETAAAGAKAYAEIKDDETAKKAQSLRSRLLELSGKADKTRETQKKPHLEAGKAIDAKYQPLIKAADAAALAIRTELGKHETRKANAAAAAQKLIDDARILADRDAAKAAAAGKPAPPPAPEPPPPAPMPVTTIRGGSGRAATVKIVKKATVVDQDRAYLSMRAHPEIVELIAKLAQRAATAGVAVDGVTVTEVRDVV